MYRIVICEDEAPVSAHIRQLAGEILAAEGIAHTMEVVESGAMLLDYLQKPENACHLIFLGILSNQPNGMQAARQLRAAGNRASIVFVAATESHAPEGYEVQALRYLLWPIDRELLKEALLYDYRNNYLPRHLFLQERTQTHCLAVRDIMYLEIARRKLAIHLPGRVVVHAAKLDELGAQLPAVLFVRCHKSYIANLANATLIRRYRLTMATGEEVPISKACYDEVKRRFLAYSDN